MVAVVRSGCTFFFEKCELSYPYDRLLPILSLYIVAHGYILFLESYLCGSFCFCSDGSSKELLQAIIKAMVGFNHMVGDSMEN
jgi:hypothetical protein